MATVLADPKHLAMADLKGRVDPDWCPGCGDFGVLAAVQKALVESQILDWSLDFAILYQEGSVPSHARQGLCSRLDFSNVP